MKFILSISKSIILIVLFSLIYACSDSSDGSGGKVYGKITGFVKDEKGNALEGVTVKLKQSEETRTTDANGKYIFDYLEQGGYNISATKIGYDSKSIFVNLRKAEETAEVINLTTDAPKVGDIKGTIEPKIEGAYIILFSEDSGKEHRVTKSDGNFIFEDMPNGRYELSIYAKGYQKLDGLEVSAPSDKNQYKLEENNGSLSFSVPYIDMGHITTSNIAVFSVNTGGNSNAGWTIKYDNRNWIKEVRPTDGDGEKTILVEIDRDRIKHDDKYNYAKIMLESTVDGSHDQLLLTVTETGNGVNLANLTIQEEKIVITPISAKIPCEILNSGIIKEGYEVGIIYSATNKHPDDKNGTREKAQTIDKSSFISELELKSNTQYWAIAYAYNESKTPKYYWSNEVITFKTGSSPPSIRMGKIETTATSATFNAEITDMGDPEYAERGYVYHTSQKPTKENSLEYLPAEKDGRNEFSAKATKIELNKEYWVSVYASSKDTLVYTLPVSFKAKIAKPTFSTPSVVSKNINMGTAIFKCSIENIGDPAYTSRGFVYGINRPIIKENAIGIIQADGSEIANEFQKQTANIQEGKIYYIYAYAENENYTEYSKEYATLDFQAKTPTLTAPVLKEKDIGAGAARFESTITLGDLPCIERGFVYGTNRNPRIESNSQNITISGTGGGVYSASFTNIPEGIYYVCAYVKTSDNETHYSTNDTELNFKIVPPVVSTDEIIEFEYDYAMLRGTISNTGEPIYDDCGFIYSTKSTNPLSEWKELLVTRNKTVGTYPYKLDGLNHGTRYYVRAYVKTGNKITYGDEVSFETKAYYKRVPNTNIIMQMYDISTGSNWGEACQLCEASKAGEYNSGWRLPTIGELSAIYSMYSANVLNGNFCTDLTNCTCWSSTFHSVLSGDKYYETYIFSLGMSFWDRDYISNSVRCVRTLP